jgi:hypothetical protein
MQQLNQCQRTAIASTAGASTVRPWLLLKDLNRLNKESRSYLAEDVRALSRLQARPEGY